MALSSPEAARDYLISGLKDAHAMESQALKYLARSAADIEAKR